MLRSRVNLHLEAGAIIKEAHKLDAGFAARATGTIGRADLALFYYGGPGRIPSFALDPKYQAPRLTPVYYRADSVGASAQLAATAQTATAAAVRLLA